MDVQVQRMLLAPDIMVAVEDDEPSCQNTRSSGMVLVVDKCQYILITLTHLKFCSSDVFHIKRLKDTWVRLKQNQTK